MRKLVLKNKTGFKVNEIYQPIVIRDHRGILFYTTEPLIPKVRQFNLPPGTYFVDTGYFTEMPFPVNYTKIPMPFPGRMLPKPWNFRIVFMPNPNKCTIQWNNKTIIFDSSFKEKPLPEIMFILFHEEGHSRYNTEKYADQYAANAMLDYGFNPNGTGKAPLDSLSDKQRLRKENIIQKINTYVR